MVPFFGVRRRLTDCRSDWEEEEERLLSSDPMRVCKRIKKTQRETKHQPITSSRSLRSTQDSVVVVVAILVVGV